MQEVLTIFQSFFSNAEYLVPTIWVALGCAIAWLLLSAKRDQEISENEAEMLWKSHKQFKHCSAKKFAKIKRGKKLIGYTCQCGHQHKQERPIINFGK